MKIKSVSRLKILLLMLPILSVAFCALSSITGGDAEAAKAMLAALEEVTPADQTQAENLAQVKIAMNAVISSGK